MKKRIFIIILSLSILGIGIYFSDKFDYIIDRGSLSFFDKSFLSDDGRSLSVELKLSLNALDHIVIYAIPRHFFSPTDTDFDDISLNTEEDIRRWGNQFTFRHTDISGQYHIILMMLYSAPQVAVSPSKNKVKTRNLLGLEEYKEGGMVIDAIGYNKEIITTYIMQNGLPVFYEKGKEGVYYEMPKVLLDKFSVTEKEFVDAVRHKKMNALPKKGK